MRNVSFLYFLYSRMTHFVIRCTLNSNFTSCRQLNRLGGFVKLACSFRSTPSGDHPSLPHEHWWEPLPTSTLAGARCVAVKCLRVSSTATSGHVMVRRSGSIHLCVQLCRNSSVNRRNGHHRTARSDCEASLHFAQGLSGLQFKSSVYTTKWLIIAYIPHRRRFCAATAHHIYQF